MAHGTSHANSRVLAPRSKFYQGPYGRICSDLPPWAPPGIPEQEIPDHLLDIAKTEMIEAPGKTPTEIARDDALRQQLEDQFSSSIPAGYTYFGQFIDHDITFDPASSLMRFNDPSGLLNHRTPRLDLDNVYGRGVDDQPYLYDNDDKAKLLIGQVGGSNLRDLPRNGQGRALIGDMRNDENSMVCQIQLAFLLAHNTLVDRARGTGSATPFEDARRTLRWLYQHIVWNDFIRRIAVDDVYKCALKKIKTCDKRNTWEHCLKDVYTWKNMPFMPVEFSVAAYRFGHSMVRNAYQTNHPHRGFGNFVPIFDSSDGDDPDDLRGFRPLKQENYIQWDWFLDMTSSNGPFPQLARKIDTKLANSLAHLHEDTDGSPMNLLAFRNLLRSVRFELPSGSDVARKFGLNPIAIAPDRDALWFYILKEAEGLPGQNAGQMLGRLGSLIVCATFAGLLKGDPNSYFNIFPDWTPSDDPLLDGANDNIDPGDWTLSSIIRLAGLPVGADDITSQS